MIRIVIRGQSARPAQALADEIARLVREFGQREAPSIRILGPAPAPMAKLRGDFRFQIQLQSPDGESLRNAVRRATADLKTPDGVAWIVDVDPLDMM
jgi:primosomal protein N' (replication factor Y)